MRIVAFITEAAPVRRILSQLVEAAPDWDALAQPQPEYVFDQQLQW